MRETTFRQVGEGTGKSLDLALSGSGFFTLSNNGSMVYSRAGNFGADRDGLLVAVYDDVYPQPQRRSGVGSNGSCRPSSPWTVSTTRS